MTGRRINPERLGQETYRFLTRWRQSVTRGQRTIASHWRVVGLIDARPGKLFKLVTVLGFVITATAIFLGRCVADRTPDKLERSTRATVTPSATVNVLRPAAPVFYEVVTAIEDIPCEHLGTRITPNRGDKTRRTREAVVSDDDH